MNLRQLEAAVHRSVRRDDLQGDYKEFINEAVDHVQRKWNFQAMEQSDEVTMKAGESAVRLPSDFKTLLSRNKSPIMLRNTDTSNTPSYFPVDIRTESEIRRLNSKHPGFSSGLTMPIWVSAEDNKRFIRVDGVAGEDLHFRVKYYAKFKPLGGPEDENPITAAYPRMIYSYATMLAFSAINDPAQQVHKAIFDEEYKENKGTDTDARYRGRDLRM